MAKRGHNRKHQHAHRVKSETADSVVYALPDSPERLAQRIDGRHRTRVVSSGKLSGSRSGNRAKAIKEQL